MKVHKKIILGNSSDLLHVFGPYDRYLKLIRQQLNVKVSLKHNTLKLSGEKEPVNQAERILKYLVTMAQENGHPVAEADVLKLIGQPPGSEANRLTDLTAAQPRETNNLLKVKPRTEGQARYMETLEKHDIVFSIGPAGTGKTYLAVARALVALRNGGIKKIVLARPAVEAGERLGFLPGSYEEKVNPYLRPLYDALESLLESQQLRRLIETDIIEVIPLAYMRGRNLANAFIILDEAQNTTSSQMKMFLTRMGTHSKIVITGDITQIDLPPDKISGLVEVKTFLSHIPGIAFCYLTKTDIVRHSLVQAIVDAYESKNKYQKKKQK